MQRMNSSVACRARAFTASTIAPARRPTLLAVKLSPITVVVEAHAKARSLKTRKAAAKRFKVTGSGKLMARHAGKQHFNEKKSSAKINNLDRKDALEAADVKRAVKCLPHSGVGGK